MHLCTIVSLQNIADCWSLLKTIVDVPRLPPAAYNHRSSPSMQKAFVMQARHVLETRWVGEKAEEGEGLKVALFSGPGYKAQWFSVHIISSLIVEGVGVS